MDLISGYDGSYQDGWKGNKIIIEIDFFCRRLHSGTQLIGRFCVNFDLYTEHMNQPKQIAIRLGYIVNGGSFIGKSLST